MNNWLRFFSCLPTNKSHKVANRSNLSSDLIASNDANWSDLPSSLIALIADHLTLDMADYVRFRAVCRAWRASTIHPRHRQHPSQLPWLITRTNYRHLAILSLSDGRKHRIKLPNTFNRKRLSLACNGWLVFEDKVLLTLSLWNPVNGDIVQLPTFSGIDGMNIKIKKFTLLFRHGKIRRKYRGSCAIGNGIAISSSNVSSSEGCTFVVSFYKYMMLARCSAKDSSWTVFDKNYAYYHDVVFVKGTLYAVTTNGGVVVFSSALEKVEHVMAPVITGSLSDCHKWHIVDYIEGKIVVLCRMRTSNPVIDVKEHPPVYDTENVHIFGLELKDNVLSLEKLNCLDGNMLFGGYCRPIVVPIDNYPLGKEDSVYFPDEYYLRSDNLVCCTKSVVFNIRDDTTKELPYDRADTSVLGTNTWAASTWLVPRFY